MRAYSGPLHPECGGWFPAFRSNTEEISRNLQQWKFDLFFVFEKHTLHCFFLPKKFIFVISFILVVSLVSIILPLSHCTHLPFLSNLPSFGIYLVFTFALFTIASVFCSVVTCPIVDDNDEVLQCIATTKHVDDDHQAQMTNGLMNQKMT